MRFRVTPAEAADIAEYVAKKRRWAKVPHFLRDAVFSYMTRDRPGGHRRRKDGGAVVHPVAGGNPGGDAA